MANLSAFEQTDGALDAKDLLDALPLLGKPLIQIRATHDLSVFYPPMSFVPPLSLLPSSPVRTRVFKVIGDIFFERGLIVLGNQDVVSFQSVDLTTQLALGM
jgi:hypothetical protein